MRLISVDLLKVILSGDDNFMIKMNELIENRIMKKVDHEDYFIRKKSNILCEADVLFLIFIVFIVIPVHCLEFEKHPVLVIGDILVSIGLIVSILFLRKGSTFSAGICTVISFMMIPFIHNLIGDWLFPGNVTATRFFETLIMICFLFIVIIAYSINKFQIITGTFLSSSIVLGHFFVLKNIDGVDIPYPFLLYVLLPVLIGAISAVNLRLVNDAIEALVKSKNQMAEWNKNLEEMVEQRTKELVEKNKLYDYSFRQLIELLPAGVAIYQNDRFVYLNRAALRMMRADSPDAIIGTFILDVVHPESRPIVLARMKQIAAGETMSPIDERILRLDGTDFRAEISSSIVEYEGRPAGQVMFHDVSWRYEAAETIARQEKLLRTIIDIVPAYITVIGAEDLRYRFVNSAYERSFGRPRSEIEGSLMKDILGEDKFLFALPYIEKARQGICCSYENDFNIVEGKRWAKVMYTPGFALDGNVETLIVLSIDITEKKEMENALARLATTDDLTGLPNRRDGMEKLEILHKESERSGRPYSLAMIDIDHFKQINDVYGHNNGDTVLKDFSDLAINILRGSDTCFRYGGEEFVILLPDTEVEDGLVIVERLRQAWAGKDLILSDGQITHSTISIGLASNSDRSSSYETLLKLCDKFLYEAKKDRRNCTVY